MADLQAVDDAGVEKFGRPAGVIPGVCIIALDACAHSAAAISQQFDCGRHGESAGSCSIRRSSCHTASSGGQRALPNLHWTIEKLPMRQPVPRPSSQPHTQSMYASHSSRLITSGTTALQPSAHVFL